MTGSRQDGWSQDEDVYLAEVVLRHIREGSTQLKAFEEVGKGLSRTPAACGFRWNSYVRKQYSEGIELAKKVRKDLKKSIGTAELEVEQPQREEQEISVGIVGNAELNLSLDTVIAYLTSLKSRLEERSFRSPEELLLEYSELKKHADYLVQERDTVEIRFKQMEKDYRGLLDLLNRARQLSEEK
ncbi:RsfA family transcriptional regulator [Pradoshia sp. D12]|uniref:RsfA family transcriptional regulator n=1 Tax=Bacillaceae TaxID=186817 RepID=UPI001125D96A|nr:MULTISPECIES: RsfA family transcriptional regulator [Bacillaceae]QFK70883.1 RsfA family transcriptional regulator [Pradoshia sp. D12]TPF72675.1 RsfA family transcriptional regulator [Bacillus sp. D12]